MDDEQAAAGPEHAIRLGEVGRGDAAEPAPEGDEDVARRVAERERERALAARDGHRVAPGGAQTLDPGRAGDVEHRRGPADERAERVEGARDLALDVHGTGEAIGEGGVGREGEVGHGGRAYAAPARR